MTRVEVFNNNCGAEELYAILQADSGVVISGAKLELDQGIRFRGVIPPDTTLMVAIATSTGAVLTAFINRLFSLREEKARPRLIVIHMNDGTKIEVPAGTPETEVATLVSLAQGLQPKRVQLVS